MPIKCMPDCEIFRERGICPKYVAHFRLREAGSKKHKFTVWIVKGGKFVQELSDFFNLVGDPVHYIGITANR